MLVLQQKSLSYQKLKKRSTVQRLCPFREWVILLFLTCNCCAFEPCIEIKEDIKANASADKIQEEIGDLLHAAISLCAFSGFSVEETLEKINKKFGARMEKVKQLAYEQGLKDLNGKSTKFMLELWVKAKETDPLTN